MTPDGLRHGGDRLDLDELISPAEDGDTDECPRWIVVAEMSAYDLPCRREILSPIRRDVHGRSYDIAELRSRGEKCFPEVLHHVLGLAGDIASRDDASVSVQRTSARAKDKGCISFHDCRIGVRNVASEIVGAHKLDR